MPEKRKGSILDRARIFAVTIFKGKRPSSLGAAYEALGQITAGWSGAIGLCVVCRVPICIAAHCR